MFVGRKNLLTVADVYLWPSAASFVMWDIHHVPILISLKSAWAKCYQFQLCRKKRYTVDPFWKLQRLARKNALLY